MLTPRDKIRIPLIFAGIVLTVAGVAVAGARAALQCFKKEMISRVNATWVGGVKVASAKAAFHPGNDTGMSFIHLARVKTS